MVDFFGAGWIDDDKMCIWRKKAQVGRYVNHGLAICSCTMCGNPRRHFGEPTLQERRAPGVDDEEWQ
jgi:hypothetical protein